MAAALASAALSLCYLGTWGLNFRCYLPPAPRVPRLRRLGLKSNRILLTSDQAIYRILDISRSFISVFYYLRPDFSASAVRRQTNVPRLHDSTSFSAVCPCLFSFLLPAFPTTLRPARHVCFSVSTTGKSNKYSPMVR